VYRQRAATAKCVNALGRRRGLQRLPLRGLAEVRAGGRLLDRDAIESQQEVEADGRSSM
jgi:hypothetical protein